MADRDDLIRERAHQIWEERGQPEGSAEDHWYAAETTRCTGFERCRIILRNRRTKSSAVSPPS